MSNWRLGDRYQLIILDKPEQRVSVENLQRQVWTGSETEIVPANLLLAVIHNGGLAIGAFDVGEGGQKTAEAPDPSSMIGFVFGFPGFSATPDGPHPLHCSHMLAVLPVYRDKGIGFALKRAQWQMVRHQGIDRITWTFDPLQSRNANLNIARLGAVCNTYLRNFYGEMRDGLNVGVPSDRFQVDWWINTKRVERRLSRRNRPTLTLAHYRLAEATLLEAQRDQEHVARPPEEILPLAGTLLLVEIPFDFQTLKSADLSLARDWRFYSREVFEKAFAADYLVTDFVHENGRSFYVLTYGETTL